MASSDSRRRWLPTAGGILSIAGGAFAVVGGGMMVGLLIGLRDVWPHVGRIPSVLGGAWFGTGPEFGGMAWIWLLVAGVSFLALGVIAMVGGVSAILSKSLGLSPAGAICAPLPLVFAWYFFVGYISNVILFQVICVLALVIAGMLGAVLVAWKRVNSGRAGTKVAPSNSRRSGLLTAGGILSITAGIFQINNGVVLMAFFLRRGAMWTLWPIFPFLPGLWFDFRWISIPMWEGWRPSVMYFVVGLPIFVFGALAAIGGISAVIRRRFGLSLIGAISAVPTVILGILAIVFVSLRKREFEVEE
jgi:hypothetical protein